MDENTFISFIKGKYNSFISPTNIIVKYYVLYIIFVKRDFMTDVAYI